jgi:hypothetical protein
LTFTVLRRAPLDVPDTELALHISAVFTLAKKIPSIITLFDVQGRQVAQAAP